MTTTTYGTIPTSTSTSGESPPQAQGFLSRAKALGRSALATRRPWRDLVNPHYFSLPTSLPESFLRIRINSTHFAMNYTILLLLLLFLSLLWHPVSLIVFFLLMTAWLSLYFLRDEPVTLLGRTLDDRFLLLGLSLLTLVLLLLTDATANILISLLVGVVVVLVHAAFRRAGDLSLEEPREYYAAAGEGF